MLSCYLHTHSKYIIIIFIVMHWLLSLCVCRVCNACVHVYMPVCVCMCVCVLSQCLAEAARACQKSDRSAFYIHMGLAFKRLKIGFCLVSGQSCEP